MSTPDSYQIRQCTEQSCQLRFPVTPAEYGFPHCPVCGGETEIVYHSAWPQRPKPSTPKPGPHIELLLDNLRSVHNVSSIFRTADGVGVQHVHLCGITPTPEHPRLVKTALGAEGTVAWIHHRNALHAVEELLNRDIRLWGLERTTDAIPLPALPRINTKETIVLIVGNEMTGIDPEIQALCEQLVAIPMEGTKRSLNVAVALGIALYWIRYNFTFW